MSNALVAGFMLGVGFMLCLYGSFFAGACLCLIGIVVRSGASS